MGITTEILSSRKKKKKRKNSLLPFLPPLPQSFKRSLIRQTASRTSAILSVSTSTTLSKSGTALANRSTDGPKSSTTWLTSSTRLTTSADSHTPNGAETDDKRIKSRNLENCTRNRMLARAERIVGQMVD